MVNGYIYHLNQWIFCGTGETPAAQTTVIQQLDQFWDLHAGPSCCEEMVLKLSLAFTQIQFLAVSASHSACATNRVGSAHNAANHVLVSLCITPTGWSAGIWQSAAWNSQGEAPHCVSREATGGFLDKRWFGSDTDCIHNLELAMNVVPSILSFFIVLYAFINSCSIFILGWCCSIQGLQMENSHLSNSCTFTVVISIIVHCPC